MKLTSRYLFPLLLLLVSGCTGYHLGTMLPPGIRSVTVPTFINQTGEPLVETRATQATIREFQRDNTLRVLDKKDADSLLTVTLTKMTLEPLRYRSDEVDTTQEYKLVILAEVVFEELKTGRVLVKNVTVDGETQFVPGSDLTSAKRQAIPTAALDLAHNIVEKVVEHWPEPR